MSYEFNAIKLELTEKVRVCTKQTEQTGTKPTGAFCIKLVSFSKLGGAAGDALGWPVEFLKYADIQKEFGEKGIQDLVYSESGKLKSPMTHK